MRAKKLCKQPAGKVIGWRKRNGNIGMMVDGHCYLAHRLAWLYMTGEWPVEVDHINVNPSDNRWANLRHCSHSENLCNRRRPKHGRSGLKGAQWHGGANKPWRSRIMLGGKVAWDGGLFATSEEAHAAYVAALPSIHGQFARAA